MDLQAAKHYYAQISLFGVAIVQTHLYYITFPKDRTFQKISVNIDANFRGKTSDAILMLKIGTLM